MLHRIAATTTGHAPADSATVKTAHLPTKPAVSGMPAIDSRKNANSPATSGERRPRPCQRANVVASPRESRTSVTTAKAPSIAKPYVVR